MVHVPADGSRSFRRESKLLTPILGMLAAAAAHARIASVKKEVKIITVGFGL